MERSQQTEERILQMAMEVFIEKGWHGARMQEIADRAGINKALLHYYFRSKENMYETIFKMVFTKFMRGMEQALGSSPAFKDVLRNFIETIISILSQNPRIPLFLVRELSEGGTKVPKIIRDIIEQQKLKAPELMFRAITTAREKGEIAHVDDPVQLLLTILGSIIYYFIAEPIISAILPAGVDYQPDAFVQKRADAVFNFLYYGLKPREDV